jgi:hypothetical protein
MVLRFATGFALLAALGAAVRPGMSQAVPAADSSQMQAPPLLSGQNYPSEVGSEERSNIFTAGLSFTTGYDDNVLADYGQKPVSSLSYIIRPSISLNQTAPRQSATVNYSPGFSFYQNISGLNQTNQSLTGRYSFRASPHTTVSANETFSRTAGIFNQSDDLTGTVSGSSGATPIIVPYADQISNSTGGGVSYQFSLNGMLGASGNYGKFSFPHQTQATGLYDSSSSGGAGYYSERLTQSQYIGFHYVFSRDLTLPDGQQSEALTHSFEGFYSFSPRPAFSISVSGGPQYTSGSYAGTAANATAKSSSWGPAVSAGVGYQGTNVNVALSFSHAVAGGMGLIGVFETTGGNASLRWKATRMWTIAAHGSYRIQKDQISSQVAALDFYNAGGHSLTAGISASREFGEHFSLMFGYDRIHQAYAQVASIANDPDNNHEYVSISYQFTRPLGR